jgi:hypothetical protein
VPSTSARLLSWRQPPTISDEEALPPFCSTTTGTFRVECAGSRGVTVFRRAGARDDRLLAEELPRNLDRRLQEPARVVAQVEDERRGARLLEFVERFSRSGRSSPQNWRRRT